MKNDQIYAVVDIETTGTDPQTDRIIQFGCVLVKNGEIINRFATDVNPNKMIPKQIQNLTKITNARVQRAPYFEDIAPTLSNLLADTVFVAHNIYFDYQFLNHELLRCGMPKLTIPGIDTVELAQIFLPKEPSFRLMDLANRFGLTHENPHQADSDAEVTAMLLLYIESVMRSLPLVTMEQIARLASHTGMQTGTFIKKVTQEMRQLTTPLPEELMVVSGIALKRKTVPFFSYNLYEKNFPLKKRGKEKLFGDKLVFYKEQARLMNLVYRHFAPEVAPASDTPEKTPAQKDLLIEAATGMGKTIGYLLPLAYLATPEQPLVVSTASLLLQDQLLTQDVPKVNAVLPQPLVGTVIKGQRHYLDLARFQAKLTTAPQQKQYQLYQMATLVWLTQTTTGDFDELNLVSLKHPFFQDVCHRGLASLEKDSPFYAHDFLRFLSKRMKASNLLIVNHAFLARESLRKAPFLPKSRYLIIDEAHHLATSCEQAERQCVATGAFRKSMHQVTAEKGLFEQVAALFESQPQFLSHLGIYAQELQGLVENQEILLTALLEEATTSEEIVITQEQMMTLPLEAQKAKSKILLYYEEAAWLSRELHKASQNTELTMTTTEELLVADFQEYLASVNEQGMMMKNWLTDWRQELVHFLVPDKNRLTGECQLLDLAAPLLPRTKWYPRYEKILYVGGTLKVSGNQHYISRRLGIPEAPLKVVPAPFDYGTQTQLLVPAEGPLINEQSPEEYNAYLIQTIEGLIRSVSRPILILFTAHDVLQKVYSALHKQFLVEGREILAQGMGGSREKLLRRFSRSKDSVLLGADSFWEGVDLPGEQLEVLVVTRLPFENPKRPLVAARNRYLEEQGLNPFSQVALPQAALRLRQAYGRLVRSPQDRGVMIVLDRRLVTSYYGHRLTKAFPKKAKVQECSIKQLEEKLSWLKKATDSEKNE